MFGFIKRKRQEREQCELLKKKVENMSVVLNRNKLKACGTSLDEIIKRITNSDFEMEVENMTEAVERIKLKDSGGILDEIINDTKKFDNFKFDDLNFKGVRNE